MSRHKNYGIQPTAVKEKREYTGIPNATPTEKSPAPAPKTPEKQEAPKAKPPAAAELDKWMRAHNLPAGWQREIKTILKDVL